MTIRRIVITALTLLALGAVGLTAARLFGPTELRWRAAVLSAKLNGLLPQMPFLDLVAWLAPNSSVYLAPLAENPNPHAGVRNAFVQRTDVDQGKLLYLKHCHQCHGENGRGNSGPNLIEAVSARSDWSYLAAVKWGLAGTAMPGFSLPDLQIWQIHAFLREEGIAAAGAAPRDPLAASRPPISVEYAEIVGGDGKSGEWLTYAGNYLGHRHTRLDQVSPGNVGQLRVAWTSQRPQVDRELQVSPIVADGVMYVSESRGGVVALDAKTGETLWTYRRQPATGLSLCCGMPNRGVAVLGSTVFVATIDAFLVALDANSGKQKWITAVADHRDGYTMTGAPLALADRIIVGVAGGEFGARGFIAAFEPASGRVLWRFDTVPGPGDSGNETWAGESWKFGGVPTWNVGSYDPDLDLIFWGTGNPGPVFNSAPRQGDNLFSNCVLAIEAKTGKLRWHYQFTPGDDHDWDATQQPILASIPWKDETRSVVLWANRNAFFYALDRATGQFLFAKPFVKQTWNEGFDARGRPKMATSARPTASGALVWPATMAATNWWPPSYDAARQLVFVPTSDAAGIYFRTDEVRYIKGERFEGGSASFYSPNLPATAYLKAIDARTGEIRWQAVLEATSGDFVWTVGGVLSTDNGLVFSGYRDFFRAFDADTGRELWKINVGARVRGSPIAYSVEGKQYIAVAAGNTLFAFELAGP